MRFAALRPGENDVWLQRFAARANVSRARGGGKSASVRVDAGFGIRWKGDGGFRACPSAALRAGLRAA
jgi:hypothetical protein